MKLTLEINNFEDFVKATLDNYSSDYDDVSLENLQDEVAKMIAWHIRSHYDKLYDEICYRVEDVCTELDLFKPEEDNND